MNQTAVPVLMYHALDDRRSVVAVSEATFEWQMQWLHEHGIRGISAGTILQHLLNREPLPERCVGITFDDGFESVYSRAFPILRRYGFSATVFLVTDYCGGQNDWPAQPASIQRMSLLTWTQVKEIAAHTLGHPRLDQLAPDNLAHELIQSKAQIEEQVGHSIEMFAYPYGRYDERVRAMVGKTYAGAWTAQPGMVTSSSDHLALARIDFGYLAPGWVFQQLTHPLFRHYVGLRRVLRTAASRILRRPWQ
jgi:peptidoglycan/xylan/chitin deacetylase (PgdA/CDA1 family)